MMKVWCLSILERNHIYSVPTSVSAHWRYRFFDVQFNSDVRYPMCKSA